jgi:hypothetical protein
LTENGIPCLLIGRYCNNTIPTTRRACESSEISCRKWSNIGTMDLQVPSEKRNGTLVSEKNTPINTTVVAGPTRG